jgi:AcrR family transcriptional regulator
VQAAARLFAERGFAGTGVGDIAEHVGITAGAMYRYFRNNEDLLATVLKGVLSSFAAVADSAAVSGPDPEQRLRRMVAGTVDLALSRPTEVAAYMRERRALSGEVRVELRAEEHRVAQLWTEAVRGACRGLSPDEAVPRWVA